MCSDIDSVLKKYASMPIFEFTQIDSPESGDLAGDTPFHCAAFCGELADLEVMLPYVKDIDVPGDIGNTALHYAAMGKHKNVIDFLLKNGANINIENEWGETAKEYIKQYLNFDF